jgi:hypothetical protein
VALGVGAFLRIDLEIDFRAIGQAISDFFTHLFGGAPAAPALETLGEVLGRLAAPAPAPAGEEAAGDQPLQDPALA